MADKNYTPDGSETNLEKLMNAGCLRQKATETLTATQKSAIEALSDTQIATLIEVHEAVGPVDNSDLI